jgi:hypothetical protein
MKKTLLKDVYPVFSLRLDKRAGNLEVIDQVLERLKRDIEDDKVARLIGEFDHLAHTRSLPDGKADPGMLAAANLVFCFGKELPQPQMLAVRPRAIGVAEYLDYFVVSFMEAPMPAANEAMHKWVAGLAA